MEKKITIGVDARPLSSPVTGVARVISRILYHLPSHENLEYQLYSNRPIHDDYSFLSENASIRWIQGEGILAKKGGLWFNIALPAALRKSPPDLFWGSQQVIPPFLPKGLPVVLTYYDLVLQFFPSAMRRLARIQQRAVQTMSVSRADYILTISEQTRRDMIEQFGYPRQKCRAALLGYEETKVKKKKKMHHKPYILAVSTLEPRKNYSTLLHAYSQYFYKHRDALDLVIVGRRGWESPEFFSELERLIDKTQAIHVVESASDADLRHYYEGCTFFVMPSIYEGFGLPMLEAMCLGARAIVSDIPCFHEIGGNQAVYVPPKDVQAWVKALSDYHAIYHKGKMRRLRFEKDHWTWQRTAELHFKAFQELLPGSIISQLPSKITPSAI